MSFKSSNTHTHTFDMSPLLPLFNRTPIRFGRLVALAREHAGNCAEDVEIQTSLERGMSISGGRGGSSRAMKAEVSKIREGK